MAENILMSNINKPPLNNEKTEETKKDSPEKELKEELKQVGQITSTHGIARLISRPLSLKIIWAIFFLISVGACLFILVGNFRDYFKFDVNTLVKVVPQDTIPLPSITICNLNPLITQAAQEYIGNYYKDTYNITISSYKQFQNLTRSGIIPNDITWLFYQSQIPGFNATLRDSFGFSLDEQALWCKLLFGNCNREAFRRRYHSNYGNCFEFNSGLQSNGSEIDLVQVSAEEFGLDMAIFTGLVGLKEPYFVERLRGIVLIIEQQNVVSLGQGQILLKPGSYANIALTIKNSTNLPLPYNDCYDKSSMKSTVLTDGMHRLNMTYDRSNCFSMCLQKGIIETFGCYDVRYPALFDNVPPCNTRDLYRKINAFSMSTDECELDCPFDCNQVIYDMSISYASFPNYNSFKIINRTNYEFLTAYFPNGSFDYFDLQNTSVGFFIYFDPLTTLMISQTPMYSFPDLVCNAGGTLGVFLGLSLLSFVELLEVAILVCIFVQKK